MDDNTRFEYLIGLHVTDEESYRRYRAGMTPILTEYGGSFRYDFRVGEVLKSETTDPINRLFVISFPSHDVADRFFADEAYAEVRATFFEPAVAAITTIAEYERATTP